MPSTVPRTRKQLMDVSNDSTHSENIQCCSTGSLQPHRNTRRAAPLISIDVLFRSVGDDRVTVVYTRVIDPGFRQCGIGCVSCSLRKAARRRGG